MSQHRAKTSCKSRRSEELSIYIHGTDRKKRPNDMASIMLRLDPASPDFQTRDPRALVTS